MLLNELSVELHIRVPVALVDDDNRPQQVHQVGYLSHQSQVEHLLVDILVKYVLGLDKDVVFQETLGGVLPSNQKVLNLVKGLKDVQELVDEEQRILFYLLLHFHGLFEYKEKQFLKGLNNFVRLFFLVEEVCQDEESVRDLDIVLVDSQLGVLVVEAQIKIFLDEHFQHVHLVGNVH